MTERQELSSSTSYLCLRFDGSKMTHPSPTPANTGISQDVYLLKNLVPWLKTSWNKIWPRALYSNWHKPAMEIPMEICIKRPQRKAQGQEYTCQLLCLPLILQPAVKLHSPEPLFSQSQQASWEDLSGLHTHSPHFFAQPPPGGPFAQSQHLCVRPTQAPTSSLHTAPCQNLQSYSWPCSPHEGGEDLLFKSKQTQSVQPTRTMASFSHQWARHIHSHNQLPRGRATCHI